MTNDDEIFERSISDTQIRCKPHFSEKHQKRIRRIKRKHRTDLQVTEWSKQKHASRWMTLKDRLLKEACLSPARLRSAELSVEEFRKKYEGMRLPCIISECADEWPARERWSISNLREAYGKIKFKCGEDDEGYSLKVKLETFIRYQESSAQLDDSPLYIFDSSFDRTCENLLTEYSVPSYFPEDLFCLVGERRRPPHRWFLIGPERSGTTIHVDPLETSAWNTSIRGRKLWAMFSPEVPKITVKGKHFLKSDGDDEAVDWFDYFLPKILNMLPSGSKFFQFIQYPGETVFVPHGWWHAVLNLDDTVAITHNYGKLKRHCFIY